MDRICFGVQRTRDPHLASREFSAKILSVDFVNFVFILQDEPPSALRYAVPYAVGIGRSRLLALYHLFVRLAKRVGVHRALRIRNDSGEFLFTRRRQERKKNEKQCNEQKI